MASQRDQQHLKKVGLEGFALIEEFYGRSRRPIQSQRLQSSQPQVHQSHYQYFYYQHQQSYVCQVPQVYPVSKDPVTNYPGTSQHQYHGERAISERPQVYAVAKEPVTNYPGTSQHQYYGGRSISERPKVFVAEEPVVSSNEAAQFYGGTMIIDYSKNKPLRRPYY